MSGLLRPIVPVVLRSPDSADFFDAARDGRLLLRRCDACGTARAPQVRWCHECREIAHTPIWASGDARLESWTVVHRPPLPALVPECPYVAGLVELDEGPLLLLRVLTLQGEKPARGMRLRVVTAPADDEAEAVVMTVTPSAAEHLRWAGACDD
jgi:uncharacterized OB-fold protein